MSALGYVEEFPLFGELVGIEPINSNEPINIGKDGGHELLYDGNLTDVLWFSTAVQDSSRSDDWCEVNGALQSLLTKDMSGGNNVLAELMEEVSSTDLTNTLPDDQILSFDESLASLVSLLESQDTTQLATIDLDGLYSPASDQSSVSYSSFSPAADLESESTLSPSSLGDSEYSDESLCPSYATNGFQDPTMPGEISYVDAFQVDFESEMAVDGLYEQGMVSSKVQPKRSRGKAHRPTPYTAHKKGIRLDELEPVERFERKKEQNKTAASRYRLKKKAEKYTIDEEHEDLQEKNKELKGKVSSISREIQYLKELMKEVLKAKKLKKPKGKPY